MNELFIETFTKACKSQIQNDLVLLGQGSSVRASQFELDTIHRQLNPVHHLLSRDTRNSSTDIFRS